MKIQSIIMVSLSEVPSRKSQQPTRLPRGRMITLYLTVQRLLFSAIDLAGNFKTGGRVLRIAILHLLRPQRSCFTILRRPQSPEPPSQPAEMDLAGGSPESGTTMQFWDIIRPDFLLVRQPLTLSVYGSIKDTGHLVPTDILLNLCTEQH